MDRLLTDLSFVVSLDLGQIAGADDFTSLVQHSRKIVQANLVVGGKDKITHGPHELGEILSILDGNNKFDDSKEHEGTRQTEAPVLSRHDSVLLAAGTEKIHLLVENRHNAKAIARCRKDRAKPVGDLLNSAEV